MNEVSNFLNIPKNIQGDKGIIFNLINSFTNFIGISIKSDKIEELIEVIIDLVNSTVPTKTVYNTKRQASIKKGKKIPEYEFTYYNILLYQYSMYYS